MATGSPLQPGQLSPDGLWRWDGVTWVPVAPGGSPMPPPRRSRAWIWWLGGGCAVLLVIGVIGIGFGAFTLVNRFQHGGFSCLPSDFPNYPNATVANQQTKIGAGIANGDTKECLMVLESNDDVATVTAYYEQQLNSGDWTISSSDLAGGTISFQLQSRLQTGGTVTLLARGQHTEVRIVLDS
jgi:hypothetical protein